jgi:FkbM family methyltransferase
VHSFEPVAPIYELLRENVARFPACVAHPYGLSSRAGQATITDYPGAATMSGLYADPERDRALLRTAMINLGRTEAEADLELQGDRCRSEALTCELRTLSAVIGELSLKRIDLLKIDVERRSWTCWQGCGEGLAANQAARRRGA